jgi:hypothetical protein
MPESGKLLIGAEVPDARATNQSRVHDRQESRREFQAFAWRSLIFVAPILLVTLVIEAELWHSGETWPIPRVIAFQEKHPRSFFGRLVIGESIDRYKFLQVLQKRPQILVLGSSRMRQFRSEAFGRQAAAFYNGGGMVHCLEDLRDFVERLPPDATPKIVILGIDFWWLNANETKMFGARERFRVGVEEDVAMKWQAHVHAIAGYLRRPDLFVKAVRATFGSRRNSNAIGLQAVTLGEGFRVDGSKLIDVTVPTTAEEWRRRFPPDEFFYNEVNHSHRPFAYTACVSPQRLQFLRQTLLEMQQRGIFVIGYNPPVISAVARAMQDTPGQKDFWRDYHQQVPELFRSLDLPFFDFATPQEVGLDDRYMRDWCHTHDTIDLKVLRHFCDNPKIRALFPEVPVIAQRALNSPRTNPLFLDLTSE